MCIGGSQPSVMFLNSGLSDASPNFNVQQHAHYHPCLITCTFSIPQNRSISGGKFCGNRRHHRTSRVTIMSGALFGSIPVVLIYSFFV
jgi:hypothetical protein